MNEGGLNDMRISIFSPTDYMHSASGRQYIFDMVVNCRKCGNQSIFFVAPYVVFYYGFYGAMKFVQLLLGKPSQRKKASLRGMRDLDQVDIQAVLRVRSCDDLDKYSRGGSTDSAGDRVISTIFCRSLQIVDFTYIIYVTFTDKVFTEVDHRVLGGYLMLQCLVKIITSCKFMTQSFCMLDASMDGNVLPHKQTNKQIALAIVPSPPG